MQFTYTNQIKSVLFKIIHIWLSNGQNMAYMLISGHAFFGHNSIIFGPVGLIIFRELYTIIYRLAVRNPSCDAYFSVFIIWPPLAVKQAWPPCTPLWFGVSKTRPKIWPTRRNLFFNHYLKIMFSKFSVVNPPPL